MSGLYNYRWQQASKAFLALPENVLCRCIECAAFKRRRVTSVVDHDPPHRGDVATFWDRSTWRAMSKRCHDSYKQRLEKSGRIAGADARGVPIDPNHPWNVKADG